MNRYYNELMLRKYYKLVQILDYLDSIFKIFASILQIKLKLNRLF